MKIQKVQNHMWSNSVIAMRTKRYCNAPVFLKLGHEASSMQVQYISQKYMTYMWNIF